jgi:hypothetical protein
MNRSSDYILLNAYTTSLYKKMSTVCLNLNISRQFFSVSIHLNLDKSLISLYEQREYILCIVLQLFILG